MENMIMYHDYYDKISDDIMYLGRNVILRFNVSLSSYNNEGKRSNYHREFFYEKNGLPTAMMRRSFDCFFSIENIVANEKGEKEFIRIGIKEFLPFQYKIKECAEWFTNPEYEDLYAINHNDKLIVQRRIQTALERLPMQKYLLFEPSIVEYDNGTLERAVRIYLNSQDNFVDLNIDTYMALWYIVVNFNMYMSAQLMLNYIQRPDFGSNIIDMTNKTQQFSSQTFQPRSIQEPVQYRQPRSRTVGQNNNTSVIE